MSDRVRSISPEKAEPFFFLTKLGIVVYYHHAMCHGGKLVHYFQCHGHSEGLYYHSMTIFTVSSKSAGPLASKLDFTVHKPECPVEKWDYSVHGQGHSEGSKC